MRDILQFPSTLRQIRVRLGLRQKTVALELGLDPGVLCGIEKGIRGPLDTEALDAAARRFPLTDDEQEKLRWAAKHDRLINQLAHRGASQDELELISENLHAWHHLNSSQRQGWMTTVKKVSSSAREIASLSSSAGAMEATMT